MTVAGTKQIVTPTDKSLVGVGVADGKLLWSVPFAPRSRRRPFELQHIPGGEVPPQPLERKPAAPGTAQQNNIGLARQIAHRHVGRYFIIPLKQGT